MDVKYSRVGVHHQKSTHRPHKDPGRRRCILPVTVGLLLAASVLVLYTLHSCPHYYQLDVIDIEFPTTNIHKPSADGNTLIDQLRKLIFLNSGRTTNDDVYVWRSINCAYLESQNVTGPYKGWADVGHCNYLHWADDGKYVSPPNGIRSSVPLGGISTGVFELRADGTFHEWTVFNQHPAGSAKIQIMDDMFMAVRAEPNTTERTGTVARVLQTKPTNRLPGVRSMDYRGSYPVSHITPEDPSLPIDVSLYAYHWYKHGDMNTSATPAVAFTAILTNPSPTAEYKASFMINLPLGIEPHTQRVDPQMSKFAPISPSTPVNATYTDIKDYLPRGPTKVFQLKGETELQMATECFDKCTGTCQSWTFNKVSRYCLIYSDVRLNGHNDDFYSGVKTNWSADSECLTVNRNTPGFNTNGNMSLCAYSSDSELRVSVGAGDSITAMWNEFSSTGAFSDKPEGPHVQGMLSGQVTLKPMESKEVTIVLGWFFPERDFLGIPVGNFYTHFVDNSSDAARSLGKNLQNAVSDASKLHSTFFGSSVKETLQDMLINSLSHIRSAFWLKDGRWRQWEAHDCVNIDSVHNDGERHIPYIMIFPDSVINKLRAWAGFQLNTGMIQEQLRCGCQSLPLKPITVEFGCGRVMSDVSSMFIVYLLELLQWHPDPHTNDVVKEMWPNAKKAAQWHLDTAREAGLPQHLVTTYDVLGMSAYPFASYNGAFHLLAMKAAQRLALAMNDTDFAAECGKAYEVGQDAMDRLLWNSTEKYYNAYTLEGGEFDKDAFFEDLNMNLCGYEEYHREEWGECYDGDPTNPGAIMTDTFYAQVLAYSLGLGTLVKDEQKLRDHMKAERVKSDTDKGLVVVTGRYTKDKDRIPPQDHAIWMMGDANWASITIHLGEDVEVAMKEVLEPFDQWRTGLNELWNVAGILSSGYYTEESVPYITSHYGYYMSSWHIILALSGQNVDVNAMTMSFSPKLTPPYKLPVMIPTVWGSLESELSDKSYVTYTVKLEFGKVELKELTVDTCKYPASGNFVLSAESPVQWHC